jgi:hypothetical protein
MVAWRAVRALDSSYFQVGAPSFFLSASHARRAAQFAIPDLLILAAVERPRPSNVGVSGGQVWAGLGRFGAILNPGRFRQVPAEPRPNLPEPA